MPGVKYLKVFNAISGAAWAIVLLRLIIVYALVGSEFTAEITAPLLSWVQTLALMEVVHAAVGLVRSSPVTTAAQVASRLVLVWLVVRMFPRSAETPIYALMVTAWGITEVIRYPYYWAQLNGGVPAWLEYLRYTLFIVLYPLGAGSECWLIYRSLPAASFFHPYLDLLFKVLLLIYPPSFAMLYSHMFSQRRKVLGKARATKSASRAAKTTSTAAAKSKKSE